MLVLLYGYEHNFFFHGSYGYENKELFHGHNNTLTILKFPEKLIGKRAPTREQLQQYHHVRRHSTAAELQFTRNTAYCIAAPRRNFEADSAAP